MDGPIVSVVMPVYNGEPFLAEAINSILTQTFREFELLVINDGSTDRTADILERFQHSDTRIRVQHQENHGVVAARIRGCTHAHGRYIACMDADDISLPERFTQQVTYLDAHPEVGVVGGWIQIIDLQGRQSVVTRYATEPAVLRWQLLFQSPLCHSVSMMRRVLIEEVGGYREELQHIAEDYDLWRRMSAVSQLANIAQVLQYVRVYPSSCSRVYASSHAHNTVTVSQLAMTSVLSAAVPEEVVVSLQGGRATAVESRAICALLAQLYRATVEDVAVPAKICAIIRRDVAQRMLALLHLHLGVSACREVFRYAWRFDPGCLLWRGLSGGRKLIHLAQQTLRAFRHGGLANVRDRIADFRKHKQAARM